MSKTYNISQISNGAPATAATFNKPINQVQTALNDLSSRIDSIFNKSAVLQYDVTVSSDAQVGDLLYFDSQGGAVFRPAKALLSGKPGSGGQSVQAPSSRVQGLLIGKSQDTSGTLLRSGYYKSSDIITNTIQDPLKKAGLYYLSPTTAGKATRQPGWSMRQPCISYYGDGKFSMITNYLAHDNHHHNYTKLMVADIIPASSYTGSDSTQGAYVWEVGTASTGQLSPETSVVFYKGQLASSDQFKIGRSTVWCTSLNRPDAPVYLFNVYPFAYGDSVVRSIGTQTLSISAASGAVQIDIPAYKKLAAENREQAVSDITGSTISFTPVVSKIIASTGMYAANIGNGQYVVASSANLGTPVKAQQMYMNGTQRVATSLLTYTVFPKGIQSNAVISMPVQNSSGLGLSVHLWAQVKADTACDLTVQLYWVPLNQEEAVALPTTPIATGRFATNGGSANTLVYKEQPLQTTISQSGTLVAKLIAPTQTHDIYIYQAGFKLEAATSNQAAVEHTDSDIDAAIMAKLAEVLTYNANY